MLKALRRSGLRHLIEASDQHMANANGIRAPFDFA